MDQRRMRQEVLVASIFIFVGILCTCMYGYDYFVTDGFLSAEKLERFAAGTEAADALFTEIVVRRAELFLMVWLLTFTPAGKWIRVVAKSVLFLVFGIVVGAFLVGMGAYGLMVIPAVLPQGLCYLLLLRILTARCEPGGRWRMVMRHRLLYGILCMFLILAGGLLEATYGFFVLQHMFERLI